MRGDPWLPVGFQLTDGLELRRLASTGDAWQIFTTGSAGQMVLLADPALADRWVASSLIPENQLSEICFGQRRILFIAGGPGLWLTPVETGLPRRNKTDAISFAEALRASRAFVPDKSLHDGIFVERLSRIPPTFTISQPVRDDIVLGSWISGGVIVSVHSPRRLFSLTGWMNESLLDEITRRAGIDRAEELLDAEAGRTPKAKSGFRLAGRPGLESFLREHVIDIVENQELYSALGIDFPSAIILHGPPGCGKTFAVERLVEHLGWPSFSIQASSVASPYIHETSRKVAEVFAKAIESAPSILVIDEMEAFLADRLYTAGSGHHRVEEIAEFLLRIPEAAAKSVLVAAMTNRIEMIDPAILRRGRFDHVVKVDMPSEDEVQALLAELVAKLPRTGDLEMSEVARHLAGRPLSDVAFVVREAGRLAARQGKAAIAQEHLIAALSSTSERGSEAETPRNIGFIWRN